MTHGGYWKWTVSGLLLAATTINYLDRQTLANLAPRITADFGLNNEQYGNIELAFGWAFAAGSLVFGFLADRIAVRWLYPTALFAWSLAGVFTAFTEGYEQLLACRILLGFFEAGHWPCALRTTQLLLAREDRTLGNSVLQSGASIGAILSPVIVLGILRWADPEEPIRFAHFALGGVSSVAGMDTPPTVWPLPFLIVGFTGMIWIVGWFAIVRGGDLAIPEVTTGHGTVLDMFTDRRFYLLLVTVTMLNGSWQLVRAWLPKFLMEGRKYAETEALLFNSVYYIATDVGCLAAGAVTLALARRGWDVHRSRLTVFGVCALLTALTSVATQLPHGYALLGVLLLVAAGSLGLFPCYYSLSQELTTKHMGKVTGLLASCGWFLSSPLQKLFGWVVDQTQSFDLSFALTGLQPLLAFVLLLLFWRRGK